MSMNMREWIITIALIIVSIVVWMMPSSIMFNEHNHNDNWGYIDDVNSGVNQTSFSSNPALLMPVCEWFETYGWKTFIFVFVIGVFVGIIFSDGIRPHLKLSFIVGTTAILIGFVWNVYLAYKISLTLIMPAVLYFIGYKILFRQIKHELEQIKDELKLERQW